MKKLMKIFSLAAILTGLFSSCTAEIGSGIDNSASKTRTITMTADWNEATRTVLDEANMRVKWDENDYKNMQLIEGSVEGGEFIELQRVKASALSLANGGETATFTFNLEQTPGNIADSYEYRAILIIDDSSMGYGADSEYYLKNTQNASATSFDPGADVLIAKPQASETTWESGTDVNFEFGRVVAVNKMTLTGLKANEDIRSVSFCTYYEENEVKHEGVDIVGQVIPIYDTDGNATLAFTENDANYDNKRVTMSYTTETADADGNFVVYFTTAPVCLQNGFSIRVVADKQFYKKDVLLSEGRKLDLKLNKINTFSVNMGGTNFAPGGTGYEKVTDVSTLAAGDELILVCEAKNAVAGAISGKFLTSSTMSGSIGAINHSADYLVLTLGGEANAWTLSNGGKYLGSNANKDITFKEVQTAPVWTIAITSGNVEMCNNSTAGNIVYNGASPRFKTYGSVTPSNSTSGTGANGYYDIQLYRKLESDVNIPLVASIDPVNISYEAGTHSVSYTITGGTDDFDVAGKSDWIGKVVVGSGEIIFEVEKNTSTESRIGSIIIQSSNYPDVTAQVDIVQAGVPVTKQYVILGKNGNNYYPAENTVDSNCRLVFSSTSIESLSSVPSDNAKIIWNLIPNGSSFKIQNLENQKYLAYSGSNAQYVGLKENSSDGDLFEISYNNDGSCTIKTLSSSADSDREYLRFSFYTNSGNNTAVAGFYSGTTNTNEFYLVEVEYEVSPSVVSLAPQNGTINYDAVGADNGKQYTATIANATAINVSLEGDDAAAFDVTDVNYAEAGKAKFKVYAKSANSYEADRQVTISVTATDGTKTSVPVTSTLTQQKKPSPTISATAIDDIAYDVVAQQVSLITTINATSISIKSGAMGSWYTTELDELDSDGSTMLAITPTSANDAEGAEDRTATVVVEVTDGERTAEATITLTQRAKNASGDNSLTPTTYTLTGSAIADIGSLNYSDEAKTTTIGGATWELKGSKDAATRKWLQLKSDNTTQPHIGVTVPEGKKIAKVTLSISNANNEKGGSDYIDKHGVFSGTINIKGSLNATENIASGADSNSSKEITINVSGEHRAIYIEASATCRIWNVAVDAN